MFVKVVGLWLLIVALGLSGCGRKGPIMVPVSGTVTLDGKPMTDGIIYFKTIAEGSVDQMEIKDGKFAGKVEVGDRRVELAYIAGELTCRLGIGGPFVTLRVDTPEPPPAFRGGPGSSPGPPSTSRCWRRSAGCRHWAATWSSPASTARQRWTWAPSHPARAWFRSGSPTTRWGPSSRSPR